MSISLFESASSSPRFCEMPSLCAQFCEGGVRKKKGGAVVRGEVMVGFRPASTCVLGWADE
jgi:hypothetical protein